MPAKKSALKNKLKIVGIGASAGGLEALLQLFAGVDPETGFAFVVIQHLDPSRYSQIPEILGRTTSMKVVEIKDGMKPAGDTVFVMPAGHHLKISKGVFKLLPRPEPQGVPSVINTFFESLAKDSKQNAIGIILSGTGSDGAAGLAAIKFRGGITMAQDPVSAKHSSMPKSAIKAESVEYVLDPLAIAEELSIFSESTAHSPQKVSHGEKEFLESIFSLVRAQMQIDFSKYKLSTVRRRIQRQMRQHRQESIESYAVFLKTHPEAIKELCEDIFIHVTEFFRDAEAYDALKKTVFPAMIKARVPGAPVRVWVPGCSTGEEAFSITILLLEFLEKRGLQIPIQIFATDISDHAIQKARAGTYSKQRLRGISEDRLKKYFDADKDTYKIKKNIRDYCVFSRHDVANNPPFAKIDLISCRNVMIYFTPELQKKVMPIFHYALNPGGFLWLGKSESPVGFAKLFELLDKSHKIYKKINSSASLTFRFPTGRILPEAAEPSPKAGRFTRDTIDSQKELDRIIMARYAPASLVINRTLEVTQVRGRTGDFLELAPGQPNYHLLKIVRPELLPAVRMAVQEAIKKNRPVTKLGIPFESSTRHQKVNIEISPANPGAPQGDRQYFVFFEMAAEKKSKPLPRKKTPLRGKTDKKTLEAQEKYIQQLLEELDATREFQQGLAEGYEAAQEELTSANEELQSTNEELQSTNEEMETGKEEVQAANEELTTINEELLLRNEELNALYLKYIQSEEYFRQMVEGIKDYAIFMLDTTGRVKTWNEGAKRLKGYTAEEIIGQHFSKFYPEEDNKKNVTTIELEDVKREGRIEAEGWRVRKDGSRFWANVIITAVRDTRGRLLGFSKITRDLTERKFAENELRSINESLERKVGERTEELTRALRIREELLSIASHELKTPLTSLKLQLQIMERNSQPDSGRNLTPQQVAAAVRLSLKQVDSLSHLVDDLLDTTKIQSGQFLIKLEKINLSDIVSEISLRFNPLLAKAKCTSDLQIEPGITGNWDGNRISQVVANLLSNVIKYAPGSHVHLTLTSGTKNAILNVHDTGPGIPADRQPRIFDRFERVNDDRNIGGLGLGLFIVKSIVEAHQGSIQVESQVGSGTKFVVLLPLNLSLRGAEDKGT
jgi:two-component system CheB/CheR fusion protein